MDVYAWLLIAVMAAGVLGTFVPMLPGLWVIFFSMLAYGIFDHWVAYPVWYIVIVGAISIGSSFLDVFGTMVGSKKFGTTSDSGLGSSIGGFIGGRFGRKSVSVAGSVLGAVAGEYKNQHSVKGAVRASAGSLIGTAVVSFIQFIVALILFVITFVLVWGAF